MHDPNDTLAVLQDCDCLLGGAYAVASDSTAHTAEHSLTLSIDQLEAVLIPNVCALEHVLAHVLDEVAYLSFGANLHLDLSWGCKLGFETN